MERKVYHLLYCYFFNDDHNCNLTSTQIYQELNINSCMLCLLPLLIAKWKIEINTQFRRQEYDENVIECNAKKTMF